MNTGRCELGGKKALHMPMQCERASDGRHGNVRKVLKRGGWCTSDKHKPQYPHEIFLCAAHITCAFACSYDFITTLRFPSFVPPLLIYRNTISTSMAVDVKSKQTKKPSIAPFSCNYCPYQRAMAVAFPKSLPRQAAWATCGHTTSNFYSARITTNARHKYQ